MFNDLDMEQVLASASSSTWLKILHLDMNSLICILLDVFMFYVQPMVNFIIYVTKYRAWSTKAKEHHQVDKEKVVMITKGDIKMVMARLGLVYELFDDDHKLEERYAENDDMSRLFEEEPSLEELKEAFDIFDENKDGFIDGQDLKRVLCLLGFKEEYDQVEKYKEMIMAVKKDGDGKIDFNEFLKFMEKCFC